MEFTSDRKNKHDKTVDRNDFEEKDRSHIIDWSQINHTLLKQEFNRRIYSKSIKQAFDTNKKVKEIKTDHPVKRKIVVTAYLFAIYLDKRCLTWNIRSKLPTNVFALILHLNRLFFNSEIRKNVCTKSLLVSIDNHSGYRVT